MHRQAVLSTLDSYRRHVLPLFRSKAAARVMAAEEIKVDTLCSFVRSTADCFDTHHYEPGHLTGSALVATPDLSAVVLTLHGKLGMWLQLGGHADGHPLLHEVALREVEEESGLHQLVLPALAGTPTDSLPLPFDIDVHVVPARRREPEHLHFDVRYLVIASDETLTRSSESLDLRWFSLAEAREVTSELSMHRQFDKLEWLRELGLQSPAPRTPSFAGLL